MFIIFRFQIFSDSESDRESGASEFDYHSDSQSEETQHPKAIEMRNQFRNTTENLIQTLQMFFGILSFELYEGKDNLKCITMIHDITSLMEVADTKLKNYINTLNSKEQIFMVDDGVLNMDPILVAGKISLCMLITKCLILTLIVRHYAYIAS